MPDSTTPPALAASTADEEYQPLLGRIALHYNLITKDQLAWALHEQSREGGVRKLGDILVDSGLITSEQLQQLILAQQDLLLAQEEAAREKQAHEQAAREQAVRDQSAREQAAREQAAREQAARDQAAREQAARDQAASEPAVQEAPTTTQPAQVSPGLSAQSPAVETPQNPPALKMTGPSPVPAAEPAPAAVQPSPAPTGAIKGLLQMAVEQGASDLHIHSGTPLHLRSQGDLLPVPGGDRSPQEFRNLIESTLEPEQRERLHQTGQVDFCYTIGGLARFRVNAYRQQNGLDAVFRIISLEPPTLSELSLPLDIARFANHHQGMVLITGPGGCGKSSTLAALVRLINEERRHHIITIEDPIEYYHPSQRCIVNQRQLERHTTSFAAALRAALREDPDVIVIGELRDLETIALALTAAETGHLVLATLHTTNATSTVNRLVGAFPPAQQSQVRTMVSESLRGVISQRLVKRRDGQGRVPALEILVGTTGVGNLIRQRKTFQLHSVIQTGAEQGMCLLDESLRLLVADNVITHEEALRHCESPKSLAESAA